MLRVSVTCEGTEPLLMSPMTEEMILNIRGKTTPARLPGFPIEEEAQEKLLYGDEYGCPGQLGLPRKNLYAALKEAGRYVAYPPGGARAKVSTTESTKMYSFLKVEERFLVFEVEGQPAGDDDWKVDIAAGRNNSGQGKGVAVAIIRPRFDSWGFTVTARIEDDVDESLVRELFDKAGRYCGLGDFRPDTGGPYGTFAVTNWQIIEDTRPQKAAATKGGGRAKKTAAGPNNNGHEALSAEEQEEVLTASAS